jgi:N-acyl-D-amino-acid deacylase
MKILARHEKLYTTHLRSEGNQLLESLYETFSCARNAALKQVHISHFKTAGKANWHKLPEALELFEEFRSSGMEITADRYPYTESMTQLSIVLPGEWEDLDDETIQQRLAEPETAQQAEELLRQTQREWDKVRLIRTTSRLGKDHAGKTIAGIAALHQLPPESAVIAILREDASGSTAAFQGMSPDNLKQIIAQPFCCCGSDENARPPDHSIGTSHPRGFGSLPRFLKFRLESGATIPEAVHQVTGLPAGIFQLADTGILAAGNAADIVLFDPNELDGCCDFTNPHTPASGIKQLFINGKAQL